MNKRTILFIGIPILLVGLIVIVYLFNKNIKHQEVVQQPVKKQSIQTSLQELTFPTYSYDAQKLRDPFVPLIVKRETLKRDAYLLESYDIEELKLTGIVKHNKVSLALIQSPDGRFYIVKENDRIGFSGGKITKILNDSIEIKEDNRKLKYLKLRTEEDR